MNKPLISVIIVNWNGLRWLSDCFGSLSRQDYKRYEIIFVDNASSDGSVEWVKKYYPKTTIVVNKKNLGFADGNNVGFPKVKGEYVLFLNNDTRVTKTFLVELVTAFQTDNKLGGAQSKILLMDEPKKHDSVGAFLTPTGFLYHFGFGKPDSATYNKRFTLYTAKGACMMFPTGLLREAALEGNIFDPSYFAYFEETDLCHRIWLTGHTVRYVPRSVIYHKMGATSTKMDNAFVQYHSFKNRINSYVKNLNAIHFLTIMPLHVLFCEIFSLVSLIRGKFALALAIQKAFWWNLVHLGKTLAYRKIVQGQIRAVPDDDFWSKIYKKPKVLYYWYLSQGRGDIYEENV